MYVILFWIVAIIFFRFLRKRFPNDYPWGK
jgi:hypothetical protein